jgi:hypothetical protein
MPRPKKKLDTVKSEQSSNITMNIEEVTAPSEPKKRGRKPKGGKLIVKDTIDTQVEAPPANVILHLKCSLKDVEMNNTDNPTRITNPLTYDAAIPPSIVAYESVESDSRFARFLEDDNKPLDITKTAYNETQDQYKQTCRTNDIVCSKCSENLYSETQLQTPEVDNVNVKDLNDKLKRLKVNLYRNTMDEKQSACFWCTYDYDNQSCYIPKYESDGKIYGYGSFCRPECAVGHLMKESLDDSTKFERYHLLNRVYGKVYGYKNNIKPAPDPHYMLDKFYGNLTIKEYRKLLQSERMLLVIDSPLTRILPELHEDTDDFIAGVYGGDKGSATQAGGVYKVKRQSEKQPGMSKATIMKEKFGFSA